MKQGWLRACLACQRCAARMQQQHASRGALHGRRALLVRYGQRPNELIVKKLALLGCVAAVLAHAVQGKQQAIRINAYAGGSSTLLASVAPGRCIP